MFSNMRGGGKNQGGLVAPSRYTSGSLGRGFKRQRHMCLGMCLVAEREHYLLSSTGCKSSFKITIIVKAVTTIC